MTKILIPLILLFHQVKPGTTLSFSASNDQKYTVIDSKIHPPVKFKNSSTANSSNSTNGNSSKSRMMPNLNRISSGFTGNNTGGTFNRRPLSGNLTPSVSIRPLGKNEAGAIKRTQFKSHSVQSWGTPATNPKASTSLSAAVSAAKKRKILSSGEV